MLEDVKANETVNSFIQAANDYLGAIGYTEHGYRHVSLVSSVAENILVSLDYPKRLQELAAIAGYVHDIGNVINRQDHGQSAALISMSILRYMGFTPDEVSLIVSAVGNHEEEIGDPVNPVAAALIMKGLSPGAALVMFMAGPAVNIASILVVRKALGSRFTWIYLSTIISFSVLFGLIINAVGLNVSPVINDVCCTSANVLPGTFKLICTILLTLIILFALSMKLLNKVFHKETIPADATVYRVEGMHCSHCEASVESAVKSIDGVTSAKASASAKTLIVTGKADESAVRDAVEKAGFTFKG